MKSTLLFFLLAAMAAGQEKTNAELICRDTKHSATLAKGQSLTVRVETEPEFVPAVKMEVPFNKCFLDMEGCEITEDPKGAKHYWRMSCADPKRVLLHSENGEIHVCMKITEVRGEWRKPK